MFTVTKNNHEQTTITKSTIKKTKITIIDETIKLDTKILLVTKTYVFIRILQYRINSLIIRSIQTLINIYMLFNVVYFAITKT